MAALILEITTRGLHRYEALDREVTSIGRALDNDIILSDPTVAPHHLRIIRHADDSVEIVNLAEINPTRINRRKSPSLTTRSLPVRLEIGRVQALLLSRDHAVADTRPLAGGGRPGHLFGHAGWAVLLVAACLLAGGLEFYLNAYNSFKWSDLLKYVLRETVLTIGLFVLALSILERLLVNRWEIRQLVTTVGLMYLLYYGAELLFENLDYLFSASWPSTLFRFGWFLAVLPGAAALYLVHISHMRPGRSLLLALLIAAPIAVPSILQSAELKSMLDDFSPTARYQNSLSWFNLHLAETVDIESFIEQARELEPGEYAD